MDDTRTGKVEVVDTIADLQDIRRAAERLAFTGFVGKEAQERLLYLLENFGKPKGVNR